jgi:hypothetical protein
VQKTAAAVVVYLLTSILSLVINSFVNNPIVHHLGKA